VVCATSFEVFGTVKEAVDKLASPFEKDHFIISYFSKESIKEAITKLQGKGKEFIDLSSCIEEMINYIYLETFGHPGLSAYYLMGIHELLQQARSSYYLIYSQDIPHLWRTSVPYTAYQYINISRLKVRFSEEITEYKDDIENSGILYDKLITYDQKSVWQKEILRLGMAKFTANELQIEISCNVMRRLYLASVRWTDIPPDIYIHSFISDHTPGVIDIFSLVKTVFRYISVKSIKATQSWVQSRVNKELGPSEKQYQFEFYKILYTMCLSEPKWVPSIEVNRGEKNKVDLGIFYKKQKNLFESYQIEFATNVRNTKDGTHSAEAHYERVRDQYSNSAEARKRSILVIIYTHTRKRDYWWPSDKTVKYIVVNHLINDTPNKIEFNWNEDNTIKSEVIELKYGLSQ